MTRRTNLWEGGEEDKRAGSPPLDAIGRCALELSVHDTPVPPIANYSSDFEMRGGTNERSRGSRQELDRRVRSLQQTTPAVTNGLS